MPDLSDLRRFVEKHLTAAAMMVEIAPPIAKTMTAFSARKQLRAESFDVALVEDGRLRVLALARLEALKKVDLDKPALEFAESPRRDRLIEAALPLREVARKLLADSE